MRLRRLPLPAVKITVSSGSDIARWRASVALVQASWLSAIVDGSNVGSVLGFTGHPSTDVWKGIFALLKLVSLNCKGMGRLHRSCIMGYETCKS